MVGIAQSKVICCCLGRPCRPALLLCFLLMFGAAVSASSAVVFFAAVWGGRVGQLCCCFFCQCGAAVSASSAVVFFADVWGGRVGQLCCCVFCCCLGRPCGPALLLCFSPFMSVACPPRPPPRPPRPPPPPRLLHDLPRPVFPAGPQPRSSADHLCKALIPFGSKEAKGRL